MKGKTIVRMLLAGALLVWTGTGVEAVAQGYWSTQPATVRPMPARVIAGPVFNSVPWNAGLWRSPANWIGGGYAVPNSWLSPAGGGMFSNPPLIVPADSSFGLDAPMMLPATDSGGRKLNPEEVPLPSPFYERAAPEPTTPAGPTSGYPRRPRERVRPQSTPVWESPFYR